MKKIWSVLLLFTVLLTGGIPVNQAWAVSGEPDYDGYLVRLTDNAPVPLLEDGEGPWGLEPVVPGVYSTQDKELVRQLHEANLTAWTEPNYCVELFASDPAPSTPTEAWSWEAMGGPLAEKSGLTGGGVRIGIIDSGIDPHNDNLVGVNLHAGRNYVRANEPALADGVGHGTQVAQMIAGRGAAGAERGLAPDAQLVPLRCFYPGKQVAISTLLMAIHDAVYEFQCDVLNMSWGTPSYSQPLEEALTDAAEKGVLLVAAAGNGGPSTKPMYPAALAGVISVGALNRDRTVARFSQRTDSLSVAAPGAQLRFLDRENQLVVNAGTSFACPAVAALTALAVELAPGITQAELKPMLTGRAEDLGTPGWDNQFGYGYITTAELLGRSWYHWVNRGSSVAAEGWLGPGGTERLLVAEYDSRGRFSGCWSQYVQTGPVELGKFMAAQSLLPGQKGFLLDDNGCPLWAAVTGKE